MASARLFARFRGVCIPPILSARSKGDFVMAGTAKSASKEASADGPCNQQEQDCPEAPMANGLDRRGVILDCSCVDVGACSESDSARLEELASLGARALREGGVVAVPTDTIYGIAALVQDDRAVKSLYDIKGRDLAKPIAICVAEVEDVYRWGHVTVPRSVLSSLLPGPVTAVFRRSADLNPRFNPGTDLIGVRVPDHALVRRLAARAGNGSPLALTSANASRALSTLRLQEFGALLPRLALAYDDGGRLASKAEAGGEAARAGSTVVDLSVEGRFSVIREGSAGGRTRRVLEEAGIQEVKS